MKRILCAALFALMTAPLSAGDLHGKVACKGVRDSSDAVVYVAAIAGKTFPAPKDHAKMDQANLVFHPRVLPVLVGTTVDFLNSDAVLHNVFTPDACAEKFNLGTWPKGQIKSFEFKNEGAYLPADLEKVRSQLKAPEWSRIVGVKSGGDGENIEVWVRNENGKVSGVAILASEPRQLTVVNLVGKIDLESLADLGGHFGIPKMKKK